MSESQTILYDGLESALVGFARRCGRSPVAVYCEKKVINHLVEDDGMTLHEAREFFEFNIVGQHLGENTPVFLMESEDAGAE